ncbi:alpha/beta hydrolase [Oerskovia paurometabola]|uniref:alpha/beta hydrolase n=1 Tax=Oerskovia paurometabola TaxID=162170 RepID=UPI0034376AAF
MTTATPPPATWVILPGLLLAPSDMEPLARVVRDQFPAATVLVLDSWETAVTAPVAAIRASLGLAGRHASASIGLVGHSVGGLAAIEWALSFPEELGAVVLLDPTAPFLPRRPERPAPVGATLLAERLVHAGGTLLSRCGAVTRRGPALRRRAWYDGTHRPDPMPDDEAARRYGTPEAWRLLVGQYEQSWSQAERVTELFADRSDALDLLAVRPVQLVGWGTRGQGPFLREERELGARLGAQVYGLPGEGHLFPLTRPDVVAQVLRGEVPDGALAPDTDAAFR